MWGKLSLRRWQTSPPPWSEYRRMSSQTYIFSTVWWGQKHKKHDDVIKWKHLPRYGPFVRGIHRFPVNFPHKGQWRGALMFSLICALIDGWVNYGEAGDLRHHRAHYGVIVMIAIRVCTVGHIHKLLILRRQGSHCCCHTAILEY